MCVTSRTEQSTNGCANLAWFPSATGTSKVQDGGYSASRSRPIDEHEKQTFVPMPLRFWDCHQAILMDILSLIFVALHMLFLLLEICMHPPFPPWQILTDPPDPVQKSSFLRSLFWHLQELGPFLFCASPPLSVQTSVTASITFYFYYLFTCLSLSLRLGTSWGQELCFIRFSIQSVYFFFFFSKCLFQSTSLTNISQRN